MATIALGTGAFLGWPVQNQIALYVPVGIILMVVVSYFTRREPEEQLHKFYTLLDTPVGKEQRLKDAHIEIKLEGESQAAVHRRSGKSRLEKFLTRAEVDGLLIVDLLRIKKKFSWARYRTDIIGFAGAVGIVIAFIFMAVILACIGAAG
jgi:hypothetical protein